jgi:hypothetical protein
MVMFDATQDVHAKMKNAELARLKVENVGLGIEVEQLKQQLSDIKQSILDSADREASLHEVCCIVSMHPSISMSDKLLSCVGLYGWPQLLVANRRLLEAECAKSASKDAELLVRVLLVYTWFLSSAPHKDLYACACLVHTPV